MVAVLKKWASPPQRGTYKLFKEALNRANESTEEEEKKKAKKIIEKEEVQKAKKKIVQQHSKGVLKENGNERKERETNSTNVPPQDKVEKKKRRKDIRSAIRKLKERDQSNTMNYRASLLNGGKKKGWGALLPGKLKILLLRESTTLYSSILWKSNLWIMMNLAKWGSVWHN